MLAQRFRFHGHGSLRFVYRNGNAVRTQYLTIKHTQNPRRKHSRIAVVVSKKVLKSAVGRNRIRRRVYEVFRRELPQLRDKSDIVCIVTSAEVRSLDHDELTKVIQEALKSGGLYNPPANSDIIKQEPTEPKSERGTV